MNQSQFFGRGLVVLLALFALPMLPGCSRGDKWTKNLPETVPAKGVVLLDGEPVEGAAVVFAPVSPGKHPAQALTGSGGRFELRAFPSKEGAVPGSYQVAVSRTVESKGSNQAANLGPDAGHAATTGGDSLWKNDLPAKYATPPSSALTAVVPPEGTSDLKIELKSKP